MDRNNHLHSTSEHEVIEVLEQFHHDNFSDSLFWSRIKSSWTGDEQYYDLARQKLIGFIYETEHQFMQECISEGKVDSGKLLAFKTKMDLLLPDKLNSFLPEAKKRAMEGPVPQPAPLECDNLDFEKCDFTNWQMFEGNVDGNLFGYTNIISSGTFGNNFPVKDMQHSIIQSQGTDPNVPINMIKPGGTCSAMVGDGNGTGGKASSIRRTFAVTPDNYNFYYSYAVVMQNPGHNVGEQPYFRIRLYDQGNASISCAEYEVYGGNGDSDWMGVGTGNNVINYVDWQSAFIPLQAYIGQNMTIEFTTGDCSRGGHFCYAYIEGECNIPMKLSDTATCVGKPVTITAPDGARTYLWSNGATTPSITTEIPGEYWVRMEGTAGGCFAYDTVHIGTYAISSASFTLDTVCLGEETSFIDKSYPANTIASWKWDFLNDGTTDNTTPEPTNTYAVAGNFTAKLTITNIHGCVDDTTRQVFVAPKPVAAFTSSLACKNDSTVFTDASTGTISKWNWDFYNDKTKTSIIKNPRFLYPNQAAATAKLKVTTQYACADSITHPIAYHPMPIASFTQNNICFPSAMSFNSTSSVNGGSIATTKWDFGDTLGTATGTTPSYNYIRYGTHQVKLKVTTDKNCVDSTTQSITVYEKPKITFNTIDVCDKTATTLTNTSSLTSSATFASWQWDILNDGSNEYSTKDASHLFSAPGTYRILLKGTTSENCWDTLSKSVTIHPKPVAKFNSSIVCSGKPSTFTDQSTGTIASWKWDFDNDGAVESNTKNPTYNYNSDGTFSAELKVTSDKGCVDSIMKSVLINPLPKAAFTSTNVCKPNPMPFSNTSTVNPGNIKSVKWTFENTSSIENNPSHVFAAHGAHSVKLFVQSDSGCTDSITKPVTYFEKPVAQFTANDQCTNTNVTFNNSSSVATSSISEWKWDIGNDASIDYNTQNSTHTFTTAGSKPIKLIVKTAQGCSDTVTKNITVNPIPVAAFSKKDTCVSDSALFTNNSAIASGSIVNYNWNFGNSKNSSLKNPKCKFAGDGIYNVQLIVTSDKNCKDSTTQPINIWPLPTPDFSSESICFKEKNIFSNASSISSANTANSIAQYNWKFDANQHSNNAAPENTFLRPGSFPVQLMLKSNHGCVDSIKKNITVHPLPHPKFGSSAPEGCATWCVDFNDSTMAPSGIASYQWDFGDGSTSNAKNPQHCFENEGDTPLRFNISLSVTSNAGCTADTTIKNMITANPITRADFSFEPGELDENNNIVSFTNHSSRSNKWLWRFGDSDTSALENPNHLYKAVGDYNITLISNNDYNCIDSISKNIRLKPVYSYYIPNSFTPNGDGKNDVFYAYAYNVIDFKMYIFNRWGELLYTSYSLENGWNGLYMGNEVQIDTYVYKAYFTDIFGNKHEVVGKVSCLR
ncbi:MAG: PKD domain-containing protein [Flavobacteriales bacterium]